MKAKGCLGEHCQLLPTPDMQPQKARPQCAKSRPEQVQQRACLLGGLPNLHNPRHSDCKGRTTTDFAFDRDVPAHHLTEDLLKKKQEGRPIERPERRESANVVNLMEALRRSV